MTFKIPETTARKGEAQANNQIDPGRVLGHKLIETPGRVRVPDIAGIEYRGSKAVADAFQSLGQNITRFGEEESIRNKKLLYAEERVKQKNGFIDLAAGLQTAETEGAEYGDTNRLDTIKTREEINSRKNVFVEEWKANNQFTDRDIIQENQFLFKSQMADDGVKQTTAENQRMSDNIKRGMDNELNAELIMISTGRLNAEQLKSSVKSRLSNIDNIERASPVYSQDDAIQRKRADTLQMVNTYVEEIMLSKGYDQAASALQNLLVDSEIAPYVNAEQILKSLQSMENGKRIDFNRAAAEIYGGLSLDITKAGLGKGNMPSDITIDTAPITDIQKRQLYEQRSRVVAANIQGSSDILEIEERISATEGAFLFDNTTPTKNKINKHYEEAEKIIMTAPPEQQNQMIVQLQKQYGQTANKLMQDLSARIVNSQNEQEVELATQLYLAIKDEDSRLVRHFNSDVDTIAELRRDGMDFVSAREYVNNSYDMSKDEKKVWKEKSVKSLKDTGIISNIKDLDPAFFSSNLEIPVGATSDYREIYDRNFVRFNGNKELATKHTDREFSKTWAVNTIGVKSMMKAAPIAKYNYGQPDRYLEQHLEIMLETDASYVPDNYSIMVVPTSNPDTPTYFVYNLDTGLPVREAGTAIPFQWQPVAKDKWYEIQREFEKQLREDEED